MTEVRRQLKHEHNYPQSLVEPCTVLYFEDKLGRQPNIVNYFIGKSFERQFEA